MICFELSINGKRRTLGGVPGFGVLNANLTWVRYRPEIAKRTRHRTSLDVSLGGLDSNDPVEGVHLLWLREVLRVGDRVQVRIVDREQADLPLSRSHRPAENLAVRLRKLKRSRADWDREIRKIERAIAKERRT